MDLIIWMRPGFIGTISSPVFVDHCLRVELLTTLSWFGLWNSCTAIYSFKKEFSFSFETIEQGPSRGIDCCWSSLTKYTQGVNFFEHSINWNSCFDYQITKVHSEKYNKGSRDWPFRWGFCAKGSRFGHCNNAPVTIGLWGGVLLLEKRTTSQQHNHSPSTVWLV